MLRGAPVLKRLVGGALIEALRSFPRMRAPLRTLGMRSSQEWFGPRPVRLDAGSGRRLQMVHVDESYLAFQLFWKGCGHYEPLTTRLIESLLQTAGTFIDIGANIGFHTLMAVLSRPELTVFAYEPNPKLLAFLRENLAANGFRGVRCSPLALSSEEGEAEFYLSGSDMTASLEREFVEERKLSSREPGPASITVERSTLDRDLADRSIAGPVVCKIDVEGHEAAVFRGALETLARYRPDIICEVAQDHHTDPFPELTALGYRYLSICEEGLLPKVLPHIVRRGGRWFPNYLLTTRSPAEVQALSEGLRRS